MVEGRADASVAEGRVVVDRDIRPARPEKFFIIDLKFSHITNRRAIRLCAHVSPSACSAALKTARPFA